MTGASIRIVGLAELRARMQEAVDRAPTVTSRALMQAGLVVATEAQRNVSTPSGSKGGAHEAARARGGGTGLHVQTGRLRSSIQPTLEGLMRVSVGPNRVPYAAIHEFGGRIPARVIVPRVKKALAFMGATGMVVVRRVNWPGANMPARPYMRPALEAKRAEVVEIVSRAWQGLLRIVAPSAGGGA